MHAPCLLAADSVGESLSAGCRQQPDCLLLRASAIAVLGCMQQGCMKRESPGHCHRPDARAILIAPCHAGCGLLESRYHAGPRRRPAE
jgi:hypothetical protein